MELSINTGTTMDTLHRTIELALLGAIEVSAGAGPLRGDRVPAMTPLRLVHSEQGLHRSVVIGTEHAEDRLTA